jgi:Protein of unknown function (DUF2510)/Neocarzinostatin family
VRQGDDRPSPAAGWYVDPGGNGGLRWWDGVRWTDDVADAPPVEGAPLPPPGNIRLSDQSDSRPARRANFRRPLLIGMGIVGLLVAGAIVGAAIEHKDAGTAPTNGSVPKSATLHVTLGTPTSPIAGGLHDQEVIHIVVTGFTPDRQYFVEECKSGTSDAGDCDNGATDFLSADASGTVTVDYIARKGPFGDNNVTCSTEWSCEIAIGAMTNEWEYITVYLDFV